LTVQKLQSKCPGRIFHRKTEEEKWKGWCGLYTYRPCGKAGSPTVAIDTSADVVSLLRCGLEYVVTGPLCIYVVLVPKTASQSRAWRFSRSCCSQFVWVGRYELVFLIPTCIQLTLFFFHLVNFAITRS
jgi:hypothetical protein